MKVDTPFVEGSPWSSRRAKALFDRQRRDPRQSDGIVTAFRDGEVTLRSNRRVEGFTNAIHEHGYQGIRAGDLVIHSMDGFAGAIGVSDSDGKSSPVVHCYRPRPDVDARFYAYLLRDLAIQGYVTSLAKGIRERSTAFDSETFRSLVLPVPSLGEQRAIADYLDTETARIDALITKKRQMIDLLAESWSGEIVERTIGQPGRVALRRLVVPPIGGTWGGPVGEHEVEATCVRGADFDTRRLGVDEGSAPTRSFQPSDYSSKALRPGDLIIEKSGGGDNQPVGRVVQWTGVGRAVPTNFAARLRPDRRVHSRWLCFTLRGAYEVGLTRSWIKQTTGIQNLDLGGFLSEKVRVPELEEQEAIAETLDRRLSSYHRAHEAIDRQLSLLAEHRRALITAAVTGELRVSEVST